MAHPVFGWTQVLGGAEWTTRVKHGIAVYDKIIQKTGEAPLFVYSGQQNTMCTPLVQQGHGCAHGSCNRGMATRIVCVCVGVCPRHGIRLCGWGVNYQGSNSRALASLAPWHVVQAHA